MTEQQCEKILQEEWTELVKRCQARGVLDLRFELDYDLGYELEYRYQPPITRNLRRGSFRPEDLEAEDD